MTAFFVLSGYVIYYTYQKKDLGRLANIKLFYKKRCITILPIYYLVGTLYIIFLGTESLLENVILMPIEVLGLQSVFTSIFAVSHNGGTWFVSCILLCYLIYPFAQEIIKQISLKSKIKMLLLSVLVLLWSPFIVWKFQTGTIYSNPFFRILEFIIGILLCSMKDEISRLSIARFLYSRIFIFIEFIILIIGVTVACRLKVSPGNYMLYSWIGLPMFMLLIVSMSSIVSNQFNKNKIWNYMGEISYDFFFAQFFTWSITKRIVIFAGCESNIFKIIISFAVCMLITIMLHELFEKPIIKLLKHI